MIIATGSLCLLAFVASRDSSGFWGLEVTRDHYETLKEHLGDSGIGVILVASERNALLYSDDIGLSTVARNDWGVESVWSQTVLKDMVGRRLLAEDEYFTAVEKLLKGSYHFLSIDAATLIWTLRKNHFQINDDVNGMFSTLAGPDCEENSAVIVTAELIRRLWFEPLLDHRKLWILDLALSILIGGRDPRSVLRKVMTAIRAPRIAHPDLLQIERSILLWARYRLV